MADELPPISNPAPVDAAPVVQPVTQEPAGLSPSAAPAPVVPPAEAAPAPSAEPTKAADAPATEPQREPTALGKFLKEREGDKKPPEEPTSAEPAKDAAPKPEEPKPSEADAAAAEAALAAEAPFDPLAHEFELPATFQAKAPIMDEFRGILAERDKLPPGQFAQSLVNLHAKSMQEFADTYAKKLEADQWTFWNDSQKRLQAEVMGDSIIGGNNYGQSMERIAKLRDRFVPEGEREAWNNEMDLSGAGNMVHILRMMARVQSFIDEPRMPPPNPKPPLDTGRRPGGRRLRDGYTTTNS